MNAIYNEHDDYAADWLEHSIEEGLIAHGKVDRRSIRDVEAKDYKGFSQVHLFAGVGIWSAALRLAGYPDDRRVGTISCPCQPFSAAGKGLGFSDPRHLWPDAFRLTRELGIDVLFGEQAPTAGHWIDLVSADLESIGYAFGAPIVPAAGFGGAHIRQRFYWVADTDNTEWWTDRAPGHERDWPQAGRVEGPGDAEGCRAPGRVAHGEGVGRREERAFSGGFVTGNPAQGRRTGSLPSSADIGVVDAHIAGLPLGQGGPDERGAIRVQGPTASQAGSLFGCDWLLCHDARIRPVERGTFPLAPTHPGRVGRLRAYGNALDLETAANFIGAYMDAAPQRIAA